MVNLKFSAFTLTLCLLLTSCVCETNDTSPCIIKETTATCQSNQDFKTLQGSTNITKLIVKSKELKRINKDDLATFVNLEEIDLSDSGLEEIDSEAFTTLTKLHKLNLAGNTELKIPKDGHFISSDSLTCLNLSGIAVEILDTTLIPKLGDLDLSNTGIKTVASLENNEHLNKLVVSKPNEINNLCNIVAIKEIIQKDENGIETPFECKAPRPSIDTSAQENNTKLKTEENLIVVNTTVALEVTTVASKKEESVVVPVDDDSKAEKAENSDNSTKTDVKIKTKLGEISGTTVEYETKSEKTEVESKPTLQETKEENTNVTKPEVTKEESVNATKVEIAKVIKTENTTEDSEVKQIKPEGDVKKVNVETPIEESKTAKKSKNKKVDKEAKIEPPTENVNVESKEAPPEPSITSEDGDTKPKEKENLIAETKVANQDSDHSDHSENSDDVLLPSTANTSQGNGVNIVLGIILCVMVVGAAGFGYKYWKNRRSGYTHANTQDNDEDDKELQTIVAHRTETE